MSAVSVSARTVAPGNSKPSNGNEGDEDVRQPSVDGLHSPSSPSAPVSLPKHGMWTPPWRRRREKVERKREEEEN